MSFVKIFPPMILPGPSVESKLELLYFQVSRSSNSISCVHSRRPFVVIITSVGLVGCRSFSCRPACSRTNKTSRMGLKHENIGNSNFDSN